MNDIAGKSIPRIDARNKANGVALFPGDINLPGQLYLKILFANKPHAIINKIELKKALAVPGVIEILTAKDVPVNEYGLIMPDQPVLCGPGSSKPYADRVRFIGDQVAAVIAETEAIADQAAAKIEIEFEDLPVLTNVHQAMESDAILLQPEKGTNVFCHYKVKKGDIDEAFRKADLVVESDYFTPAQEHAYLQPEAGLGYIDEEGRVTVIVAGQWVHEDQEQIAHALNLPIEKIRVVYPAIGGAFGGREDMSVQIILALAAYRLSQKGINRPVKVVWNREESIIGHHKRHPYHINTKWGVSKEGKLLAAKTEIYADGGAYAYTSTKVLGNATLLVCGAYEIPNVDIDAKAVYTNNLPNGAFRGFGGPQGLFAAEMQMNKIAEKLNMDPVELRMKNLIRERVPTSVNTPLPTGISIQEVLEKACLASGWTYEKNKWGFKKKFESNSKPYIKHGIGLAIGYKNVGFSFGAPEYCWATIELKGESKIEKAVVYHAGADVGQGAHSAFAQIAAQALGIPIENVELVASDTATTQNSGSASASRMTFMAGNSILGAVKEALVKWDKEERPAKASYKYIPPKTSPFAAETGECMPNFAYGYVAETAEVEVNIRTGKVKILKVVCADDVGKAINPIQVRSQIEGGVVQAAGYAVLENFIQKEGRVLTKSFSTYLIPTIMDIPVETEAIIVETADPLGPLGARGMGEMPFLPFAPAVVAAVHNAIGIWFDSFPLTEERILQGLGELE
jgi:CO/xanthine dehydrogenase Mo-binding subunit